MSRPVAATTKAAKRAARQRATRGPARAAAAHTPFIGPLPYLPSVAPTRSRRGSAALEHEADRTADQILAGAVDLARSLTSTSAATRAVPNSPGRPLGPDVRARMEHGLGADLSRVRVHDDPAARLAVEHEGARAFVAGRDIYLGAGVPGADTEEGFRLLAHEVAHTLQQTGRASTGGRRRVTDARGAGQIQAVADVFLDRLAARTPQEVFATLTADHGGADPGSPIAAYHATLAARLHDQLDPASADYRALVTDVYAETHGAATVQEQSFLLDVMKAGLEWEAAAGLIELATEPLATRAVSSTFQDWLSTDAGRPVGWAAEIVETTPTLKTYRDQVYGAFRMFLVRPDLKPYRLGHDVTMQMIRPPAWTTTLTIDDRAGLAAIGLVKLENIRYALCREVDGLAGSRLVTDDDRARDFSRSPVVRGWARTGLLQPRLAAWGEALGPAGEPLHVRAVAWFEDRRAKADEFWRHALDRWNREVAVRLTTGWTDLPEERRAAMRQQLTANPLAASAAAKVSAAGIAVLAPTEAELPDAAAYAGRQSGFRTVLDTQLKALYQDLSRLRLDPASETRAALVPWLTLRLEWLRQQSLRYVAAEDAGGFDDTRHGHRLLMSYELRRLAYELADATLENATVAVQHNEAGTGSRLVLVTDWRRPSSSDLDKLTDDFSRGIKISDHVVLAPQAVAAFYREAFLRRLGDLPRPLARPGGPRPGQEPARAPGGGGRGRSGRPQLRGGMSRRATGRRAPARAGPSPRSSRPTPSRWPSSRHGRRCR